MISSNINSKTDNGSSGSSSAPSSQFLDLLMAQLVILLSVDDADSIQILIFI